MGKPTGDPIAQINYRDVAQATVSKGMLAVRVDLDIRDGSHVAFQTKRRGMNRPSVDVVELLRTHTPV